MTGPQLSDDIRDAQIAEFGVDESGAPLHPYPSKYYDYTVLVKQPNGSYVPRSAADCATNWGAVAMSAVLFQLGYPVAIVLAPAEGYGGQGGFSDNKDVPWLMSMDGKQANCGKCLQHYSHGYNFDPQNPYNPDVTVMTEFSAAIPQPTGPASPPKK